MTRDAAPLRAFLVDDEPLALERLQRLLAAFPEIQIMGTATDPAAAMTALNDSATQPVDVLFLDIQMPGMNGFELLAHLATPAIRHLHHGFRSARAPRLRNQRHRLPAQANRCRAP